MRRPDGARKAFEVALEGGEEYRSSREEDRGICRANRDATERNVKKIIEAIEEAERQARTNAQACPKVAEERGRVEEGAMPCTLMRDARALPKAAEGGGREEEEAKPRARKRRADEQNNEVTPEVNSSRRRLIEGLMSQVEQSRKRKEPEAG